MPLGWRNLRSLFPFSPWPCAQNLEDVDTYDASVVNCLQDFSSEIANEQCKEQVGAGLGRDGWEACWGAEARKGNV